MQCYESDCLSERMGERGTNRANNCSGFDEIKDDTSVVIAG